MIVSKKVRDVVLNYPNGSCYEGSILNNMRHGQGSLITAEGFAYKGNFSHDLAEGFGHAQYPGGHTYVGEWQAGQRAGFGEFMAGNGDHYVGQWKGDVIHGHGRWSFADGRYFEGTYKAGVRVHGTLSSADGTETYRGDFKGSDRHGQGLQTIEGLWQYNGEWRDDKRHGQGECRFFPSLAAGTCAGARYSGAWQDDVRSGWGRMVWPSGEEYEGQWEHDCRHGKGRCKTAQGDVYTGEWVSGLREDLGRCVFANGDIYEGAWKAGARTGLGTMMYSCGEKYNGSWLDGRRHGQGSAVFEDGTCFSGAWEDDCWVQSCADPRLCRVSGPGMSRAVAGQQATFIIEARDNLGNKRLNGGDTFQVVITPAQQILPQTGAIASVTQLDGDSGKAGPPKRELPVDEQGHQDLPDPGMTAGCSPAATGNALALDFVDQTSLDSEVDTLPSGMRAMSLADPGSAIGESHVEAELSKAVLPLQLLDRSLVVTAQGTTADVSPVRPLLAEAPAVLPRQLQGSCLVPAVPGTAAEASSMQASVEDLGDGRYSVMYSINQAGIYDLAVLALGHDKGVAAESGSHLPQSLVHVADSPYHLRVLAAEPCKKMTCVVGAGRSEATCGRPAECHVQLRDKFGNHCSGAKVLQQLQVQARIVGGSGGQTFPVRIQGKSAHGAYSCSYTGPDIPGYYRLEVVMQQQHHASAAATSIAPAAAAAAAAAAAGSGPALTAEQHLPGSPFSVLVLAASEETDSCKEAAGHATGAAVAALPAVSDHSKHWEERAKAMYAEDGDAAGWDSGDEAAAGQLAVGSRAAGEAAFMEAHPEVPVVEKLEDLWRLSKLQALQKRK